VVVELVDLAPIGIGRDVEELPLHAVHLVAKLIALFEQAWIVVDGTGVKLRHASGW
jgi:hypothetical protein